MVIFGSLRYYYEGATKVIFRCFRYYYEGDSNGGKQGFLKDYQYSNFQNKSNVSKYTSK